MITSLYSNGNSYREVYALGDSAFMAGNNLNNPFLFDLSQDWKVTRYDTAINRSIFGDEGKFNVRISRETNSIEDYSKNIRCDSDLRSLAAPKESLVKKIRGFYTYYFLKVVYKKLPYEVAVPIGNYLSKEEQILWTQGGFDNYKTMTGSEMNDYLNEINDKAMKWYGRNIFEASLNCIKKHTENYDLDRDKENIFKKLTDHVKFDTININPRLICNVLDSYYKTTYFSKLYNTDHEILDKDTEQTPFFKISNDVFSNDISYELVLPGKVLQTNAPVIRSDTLVWKVDGIRLLFDDYTLKAEYRVINKWSFLLTGLLLIISIGSIVALIKRRRKSFI